MECELYVNKSLKRKIKGILFFELFKFVPLLKIAVKFPVGQGARPLSIFSIGERGDSVLCLLSLPIVFY